MSQESNSALVTPALYRYREVEVRLGLSRYQLYQLIEEGLLQRVYPRPKVARITAESVERYLELVTGAGDIHWPSPNSRAKSHGNRARSPVWDKQLRKEAQREPSKLKSLRARLGLGSD